MGAGHSARASCSGRESLPEQRNGQQETSAEGGGVWLNPPPTVLAEDRPGDQTQGVGDNQSDI